MKPLPDPEADSPELFTLMDDNYEEPPWDMSKGSVTFFVIQSWVDPDPKLPRRKKWLFEFEYEDYDGCVGWMQESIGLDYFLTSNFGPDDFKEGWTYTIHGITVHFTRGDGWTTDDDETWEWETVTRSGSWFCWLRHKIAILWWRYVWYDVKMMLKKRNP